MDWNSKCWIISSGLSVRIYIWHHSRTLWCTGICSSIDLGGRYPIRYYGICLPICVFTRHDCTISLRGSVLWIRSSTSKIWNMDEMGKNISCCDHAGYGRILFNPSRLQFLGGNYEISFHKLFFQSMSLLAIVYCLY
mgnify:CR=1 FL=1